MFNVIQETTNEEMLQENIHLKDDFNKLQKTIDFLKKGTVPPFATKVKRQLVNSVGPTCADY